MTLKNDSPPQEGNDPKAIDERLAELVKETIALRTESSLSQGQVAMKLGMSSHSHIAAIETGRVVPRLDTFLKILALYNRTIEISGTDTEK